MKLENFSLKTTLCFLLVSWVFVACTRTETSTYDQFFLRNDGADLNVEINGNIASDVFIILLHGGPGGGSYNYNAGYYAQELEEDYAMVYLDQRGNGASTGNYDREDLTLTQNSEDIKALVDLLKARYGDDISMFLAGHSWGGMTSAHALIHTDIQDDLKGWLDIDGVHDFLKNDIEAVKLFQEVAANEIAEDNNVTYWEEVLERVNEIDTLDISVEDSGYLNATGFDAERFLDLGEDETGVVDLPYLLGAPGLSLASFLSNRFGNPILNEDSENNPLTDRLNEITIPCLFMWGQFDFVVPPAMGVCAFEAVITEEKELIIYEVSGHSPMTNEPIKFTEDFKAFIEEYK